MWERRTYCWAIEGLVLCEKGERTVGRLKVWYYVRKDNILLGD